MGRVLWVACLAVLLSSCFFTQQVVSTREAREQALRTRIREAERRAYLAGWKAGRESAFREVRHFFLEDPEVRRGHLLYEEVLRSGNVEPPEVVVEERPGRVSPDGRVYEGPRTVVRIVRPARLVDPQGLTKLLEADRLRPVAVFDTRREAERFVASSPQKEGTLAVLSTPDGKFVVVQKVR